MTKYIRNDGQGNSCVLEIRGNTCEVSLLTAQQVKNISDQEWHATIHEAINTMYTDSKKAMQYLTVIM